MTVVKVYNEMAGGTYAFVLKDEHVTDEQIMEVMTEETELPISLANPEYADWYSDFDDVDFETYLSNLGTQTITLRQLSFRY